MAFSQLGLGPDVLRAISDSGYDKPTPIQEQAIPVVLMGRDVLGCAQTGTGKTAGFTLPMIDILSNGRAKARMPRSLIIEPTRELAAQVAESFDRYGKYHPRLSKALLIGGESFVDQQRLLDRGVDVLIATPGRLLDLFERGKILLSDVKILVIDEADRMLDMGFIPDIERIVSLLPKIRQTLLFSATMPPEIRRLADAFLMNPKSISVAPPASPAEMVIQKLAVVPAESKRQVLRHLLNTEDVKNAIVFCNRKRDVDILHKSLKSHGFDVVALHGDMSQPARTETLERFRNNEVRVLVASDVAARGLDIQGLSHVFNFDVPIHAEDYVHRIGRTGRAGREGRSFTLAVPSDGKFVAAIEALIGKAVPRITIEGMEAGPLDENSRSDRGRSRGPRGGRPSGRDKSADTRRKPVPKGQVAAAKPDAPKGPIAPVAPTTVEPVTPPAPVKPASERPETRKREQRPQSDKREQRPQQGDKRESRRSKSRGEGKTHRGERKPDDSFEEPHNVVAFGDHMPAFLRIPVPISRKAS
ncbi:MAG: DEAD/DEAH box helicase [Dongiaceae bacterium]